MSVRRNGGDRQDELFALVSISDGRYYEVENENRTILRLYSRNRFVACSEPLMDIFQKRHLQENSCVK